MQEPKPAVTVADVNLAAAAVGLEQTAAAGNLGGSPNKRTGGSPADKAHDRLLNTAAGRANSWLSLGSAIK